MMPGVVDQSERADAPRFETEKAQHPFGASKGEFTGGRLPCGLQRGLEPLLQVVDSEVVVAIEANQIVLIALVVAHKNVFAMHASVVVPPTLRLADGFSLGVVVACITDVVLLQIVFYLLLAIHSSVYTFMRLCDVEMVNMVDAFITHCALCIVHCIKVLPMPL